MARTCLVDEDCGRLSALQGGVQRRVVVQAQIVAQPDQSMLGHGQRTILRVT